MAQMKTKTIWILGASSGIGYELAILLAKQSHQLILSARNEKLLSELHDKLQPTASVEHLVVPCDCSDYENLKEAKALISERIKRIDSVIFMAGQYEPLSILDIQKKHIDSIIKTNLNGPMYLTELVLQELLTQKESQLIFCASVAGFVGLPNAQPYSASKAALINFVQSLHAEHAKDIDIKIINPGFVKTPLTDKNSFKMPFIITAQDAAESIMKSIHKRNVFEIHFPKKFTFIMKLLALLPYRVLHRLVKR
ncbi:SDR family NAD(P)-dependent oxidoreductase [Thorsellia kenyensis]|uniref:SDR family NAD(P)-dependent oxidoreductase n=1 Tax=Thorsellia kenyensis TaxID=1549888 RepID=A0ABV6CAS7_9GAMM